LYVIVCMSSIYSIYSLYTIISVCVSYDSYRCDSYGYDGICAWVHSSIHLYNFTAWTARRSSAAVTLQSFLVLRRLMVGTMQIAKTLVSWPMISGVDNSATQIQNDSEELHSQVLSAVCIFFCIVSHYVWRIYIYIYIYIYIIFFCRCIRWFRWKWW